ncbi:hypothetical protein ACFSRY_11290 [Pontibacter locisalis]|uniref:Uncharacterized protein n=1 Tax=Pontibacter locisalis TaxID=1719035 RepID=A0ABW5ILX0_9BACT
MKKKITFHLTAVLLIWMLPIFTQAQKGKSFTVADADRLFAKMYGTHEANTLIWLPQQQHFFEAIGKASYSLNKNNTLREIFEIKQPDGQVQQYEGMLRFCEDKAHFEFVQYDASGNALILMAGKWDPAFKMIQMEPIKRLWHLNGKKRDKYQELQLQYFFFDDGSFKKVLRSSEGTGISSIVFEYHCLRRENRNL